MSVDVVDEVAAAATSIGARRVESSAGRPGLDVLDAVAEAAVSIGAAHARGYDAATKGGRHGSWPARRTSPNTEVKKAAPTLRARAHDAVRNTALGARVIEILAGNLVGAHGIRPRAKSKNKRGKKTDAYMNEQWDGYAESKLCDVSGQHTHYALQEQIARALFESGDAIIRRRWMPGRPFLFATEVYESEHLDDQKNETTSSGGEIIQGVEFDAIGERVAYWLFPRHPHDMSLGRRALSKSVRVPAKDVIHLYVCLRPGQVRGVTWLAPILATMRDLDDCEDAEAVRRRLEACFAGFIRTTGGAKPFNMTGIANPPVGTAADVAAGQAVVRDANGLPMEKFEPGMFAYLPDGTEITFSEPKGIGGFTPYRKGKHETISIGAQITYAQASGDLSNANYSSLRAGNIEFRRTIESLQWKVFVPGLEGIYQWWLEAMVMRGDLRTPAYPHAWSLPKWVSVDPAKDMLADLMLARSGLVPPQEMIGAYGWTDDEVVQGWLDFRQKLAEKSKELGKGEKIVVDMDPSSVDFRGAAQSPTKLQQEAAQNEETPGDDGPDDDDDDDEEATGR